MSEYPMFALSEEHQAIREAVRAVVRREGRPARRGGRRVGRVPPGVVRRAGRRRLPAPHIPEEYGGAGADALATCIVIEEVARACASSSLIPSVNKLGTMPLHPGRLRGAQEAVPLAGRRAATAMFSYCLSEPEAGSDAAAMKTRAVRDGDDWVLDGVKRWITNAGVSEFYTVFAVTDPDAARAGISAFVVEKGDAGVSFGAPEKKLGIKGSPTREVYFDNVRIPADRMIGAEGTGFTTAMRTLDHTRVTIAAQAVGIAQGALDYALGYAKERQQFGKPIADFQGLQFMLADMGMKVEAARQLTYAAAGRSERGDDGPHVLRRGREVLRLRHRDAGHRRRRAGARRLRLHARLPGRADDARREDHPDLRGHQPGAADRDGPSAPRRGAVRAVVRLS